MVVGIAIFFGGYQLQGKQLGIIGYGRIGSKVADYGLAFGMRVVAYDVEPAKICPPVRSVSLERLVQNSDIVSIHITADPENYHFINSNIIAKFKSGLFLVNTSRGMVIDSKEIASKIKSGKVAGVAVDVLEGEEFGQLGNDPLLACAKLGHNVLLTPHIGGATKDAITQAELAFITHWLFIVIGINNITFYVSSLVGIHTGLPYIKEFERRNIKVSIVAPDDLCNLLHRKFPSLTIIELSKINHGLKWARIIHYLLLILFTSKDFSSLYERWLTQRLAGKNRLVVSALRIAIKFLPKWQSRAVNQNLCFWMSHLISNPFPTSRVVNVSLAKDTYLLCARGINVYTIVESWDHPGKAPIGYLSEKVFVWNQSLKNDWLTFQGDKNIEVAYPIKLDYAINARRQTKSESKLLSKPISSSLSLMYPATFSSSSEIAFFDEEKKLIHGLCQAVENFGISLLIKPKPNSKLGELDDFLNYKNVQIGAYQANQGGNKYTLKKNYNQTRLGELERCDLLINLGTTFAIDAAAFGLPIIQLYVVAPENLPNLSKIAAYPHLARHLYRHQDYVFEVSDIDFSEQFNFLEALDFYIVKARDFSNYLQKWIMPEMPLDQTVVQVVDSILE